MRKVLVQRISTAAKVLERGMQLQAHKQAGHKHKLDFVGVNIGFSISGLQKLHLPDLVSITDDPFKQGIAARSAALGDPKVGPGSPGTWKVGGPDNAADSVIIITGPTQAAVDRVRQELIELAGSIWKIIYDERGMTRSQDRGHEHFGFLDGVSQPGVRGQIDHTFPSQKFLQNSQNPHDPGQGLPGSDLLWPGEFVFGYPGQKADDLDNPGDIVRGGPDWIRNGSFMVFRRLNQLVPEFNKFVDDSARQRGMDADLLGARLVGRWKSGAPLLLTPLQDDPNLGGNELQNNDFEFDRDPEGRRCPFAAHIRKAYPRNDITPEGSAAKTEFDQREQSEADTQTHRILRRGIPFGPDVSDDEEKNERTTTERGLLFVCYQTSIPDQFEFILQAWVNNPDFAPRGNHPGFDPLLGQFGDDPLIGRTVTQRDPRLFEGGSINYSTGARGPALPLPTDFIVPSGGGYFFVPSISVLKQLAKGGVK